MAYTVEAPQETNYEKKALPIGEDIIATIKLGNIKTAKNVPQQMKEFGHTSAEQISFLFETDNGESGFDNINQEANKDTFQAQFLSWKMNRYSVAVGIPIGTTFASIQEWINAVVGKKVLITTTQNGDFINITAMKPYVQEDDGLGNNIGVNEDELAF